MSTIRRPADVDSFGPAGASYGLLQDLNRIYTDCGGDAEQGFERWVSHFTLNVADHLLRQPGAFGNRIHGKLSPFPFLAQNLRYARTHGLLRFFV